ncbi:MULTISPECIES: lipopolysaccharide biosynthesis protein [unclassified Paenibacillus]|uniref:lipopolysaccharide biosynthesis protein n=1 Tax=unclassified Paenibacillus TaxID=185978 RepID=UPI001AE76DEE|nr:MULTISPECIES: lipopolysaccharide biosynthesis protein [unclassified Paenibacillus]MBP1154405.1 PST family polysaccharide transporter [Paenibacillus sp. PvP091]MBP1170211.1 PST family polysaccharide transporter [Paenibacillus sp. PvR098]MBP2441239.1 PST family polysaccharide transporter [Paenibacillus sp. PvP052]
MEHKQLHGKIVSATKWSLITEVIAKIIVPLTNIILARILAPEAFGVIATITMIISFADMFTDAGFQKYLVQHQFKNEKDKQRSANVAFWTNFTISIFFWILIIFFNEQVATMVGNPGLGIVIIVACIQLPLTSFSSIQMALFRRDFDFKTLFFVRIIGILIPFVITIPLALLGLSYWSLIIGMICMQLFNAVILTVKSKWKPKFFYDFKTLKEMLSFSVWSLIEAISIWLTAWIDSFIIGYFLNEYYLGIYKTSTIMVNSLLAIVTATAVPILFSALSRLQNNNNEFVSMYFKFQRLVSMLIFPLGIGVFLYSDLATQLLLGKQWIEASDVIGIWALTSAIMIVFGHFCSEVYRAKGQPKLSFMAQILHLVVLVPTCIVAAKYGFLPLVYSRSLIRLQAVIVHLAIMKTAMKISVFRTFKNVLPTMIAAIIMGACGFVFKAVSENVVWSVMSIIICIFIYFWVLFLFPKMRGEIFILKTEMLPNRFLKSRI